jgi:2-dehydro-3-deoxyphosphooctonate aldolase (KDO 8-P synthase)
MTSTIECIPFIKHTGFNNFFLIAGPCVVENEEVCVEVARTAKTITEQLNVPYIFKSSYRKANRSKIDSFTGIGDHEALELLKKISIDFEIPVLTDIHTPGEAEIAAGYVDILQIPAFMSRQTDLLVAAAKTGKCINIKKGQFMSPASMLFAARKVIDSGNNNIILTDRGTMFGYHDLIVDFRGITEMKEMGFPVVLDVTHSLQQPNQESGVSGGKPEMIETLARAGIAVGVDGLFIETHPDPKNAKSDGANMLPLDQLEPLLARLVRIRKTIVELD